MEEFVSSYYGKNYRIRQEGDRGTFMLDTFDELVISH